MPITFILMNGNAYLLLCSVYFQFGQVDILMADENALTGVFIMRENSLMPNERSTNISIWKAVNVFLFHQNVISIQNSNCFYSLTGPLSNSSGMSFSPLRFSIAYCYILSIRIRAIA